MYLLTTPEEDNIGLIEELWNYFYDTYFLSKNQEAYENLGFEAGALATIGRFFIGIFIGLFIASFLMIFYRRVLGKFVRFLLEKEVLSAEKAVRLAETGFVTNFAIRAALRSGRALRTVVRCREEDEYLATLGEHVANASANPYKSKKKHKDFRVDLDAYHFYIPEEKKYQADVRFSKKGTSWGALATLLIVLIFTFFAIMLLLPGFLSALNSLLA